MTDRTAGNPDLSAVTGKLAETRLTLEGPEARQQLLTIEEQFAAVQRGDWNALLRSAAEGVAFEMFAPPEFGFCSRARGVEPLREAIRHNFSLLADQEPSISSILTDRGAVAVFGTERGTIRATGQSYHVEFAYRFNFNQGLLQSIRLIIARVPGAHTA